MKLYLLIVLSSFSIFCWADDLIPQTLHFQDPLSGKGVKIGEIDALFQDTEGFIWLGGRNALLRYNGYEYVSVGTPKKGDNLSHQTPLSHILDIFEDRQKQLWIGSRNGLYKYNREKNHVYPFSFNGISKPIINDLYVTKIDQTLDGRIIVATLDGLYIIDEAKQDYEHYNTKKNGSPTLSNSKINDLFVDKRNQIWLATENGLNKLDLNNHSIEVFLPNPSEPNSTEANTVLAVFIDNQNNIWLGLRNALAIFNDKTKTFKQFTNQASNPHSISANLIRDIYQDSRNILWIATDGGGLNAFSYQTEKFSSFQYSGLEIGAISSNSVRSIMEDNRGDLWIGTYPSGLNFTDWSSSAISVVKHSPNNTNTPSHKSIMAIQEDSNKNLWLGTDGGGLNYFDREKEQFTYFKHDPENEKSIASNSILSALIDQNTDLWIGMWGGGLNRYNPNTNSFVRYPYDNNTQPPGTSISNAISGKHVWVIYEDSEGILWLGTHNGGLTRFDRERDLYTVYKSDRDDKNSIANNSVWTILEDRQKRLWVGTASGVSRLDKNKTMFLQFNHPEDEENARNLNRILSSLEDSKGNIWFGTDGGLKLFNESTQSYTVYTSQLGLSSNTIHSIQEDKKGKLWLGTASGIISFDPESQVATNITLFNNKEIGSMNSRSGIQTQGDELLFGSPQGLWVLDKNKLNKNTLTPAIVFTQFALFNNPVPILKETDETGILSNHINYTDSITLDHTKNMFSITFSALSFKESEKNAYVYKLDGFDKNWVNAGHHNTAIYTNLDSGSYTFLVKASNNDGVWNETPRKLTIHQLPPIWKTWWAYIIYITAVLGILARIIYIQQNKRRLMQEQNRLLEATVDKRTTILRQKNSDIQNMLANMNQGLFTINERGIIQSDYSTYLELIFETMDIAGKNALELLFSQAQISDDVLNQNKEAIHIILGESSICYDFNSHLLAKTIELSINTQKKHIELDWNAVLDSDVVTKIMVSVRDVSKLKNLEREANKKKREIAIIEQLIHIKNRKFYAFEDDLKHIISFIRNTLFSTDLDSKETLRLILRSMHTIKGNSRTYGFDHISDEAHKIECSYIALKEKIKSKWDLEKLDNELSLLESILNEYSTTFRGVFGRTEMKVESGIWVELRTLKMLKKYITKLQTDHPQFRLEKPVRVIERSIDMALSIELDDTLIDISNTLPELAIKLNKLVPKINTNFDSIRVSIGHEAFFVSIFTHIIRNALDHGIEEPHVRKKCLKTEQGVINIFGDFSGSSVRLSIQDDGRGINLKRLRNLAIENGIFSPPRELSDKDLANYIFHSEVTTSNKVTEISGRGVGMDAVKTLVIEHGGTIAVNLVEERKKDDDFVKFEIIITLPSAIFYNPT